MRKQKLGKFGYDPPQGDEVSNLPMHPKPWALVSCSQAGLSNFRMSYLAIKDA